MTVIDVERIRFEFGESWTIAEKWDAADAFRRGVCRLQDSKAVDIVGVRDGNLWPRVCATSDAWPRFASERAVGVKQRLSWLTTYVQVESPFNGRVGDVVAQNLPGAGQR